MAVLPVDYTNATTPTGATTELPATTSRGLNAITTQINTNTTAIAANAQAIADLLTGANSIAVVSAIPVTPDPNIVYIVNDGGAPRVVPVASSATPSINVDVTDQADILTLVHNITGFVFTGSAKHGQTLYIVLKSVSAQTVAGGSSVTNGPASMLTTTVAGKYHEILLKYNSAVGDWIVMASHAAGY